MRNVVSHKGRLRLVPEAAPAPWFRRCSIRSGVDSTPRTSVFVLRVLAATGRWTWQLVSAIAARRRATGLTVAVDVTPLFGHRTGVGWYLHCLLR